MKRRHLIFVPLLLACGPFFYQAPPPLENYPQRIPGKNWLEVFHDAKPAAKNAASAAEIAIACEELVESLPALPVAERLEKIDALLERNRAGDFRLRAANFLHELREIAADDAILAAAGPYLDWRIGRIGLPAGFTISAPVPRWDWDKSDFEKATREYESKLKEATEWLDQAIAAGPGVLLPNLRVQKAALLFEYGKHESARGLFREIVAQHPDHPRAGVARLMSGRCALELARRSKPEAADDGRAAEHRQRAANDFLAYLDREPDGRFAADTCGWLAAVAWDQGDLGGAIRRQIERLDLQPTREVLRSVLRECDRFFAAIYDGTRDGGQLPFDAIAKHPEVCRLFVFHSLDPAARDGIPHLDRNLGGDRFTLDYLHRRIVRPLPWANLNLAALGEAITRRSPAAGPDPFTLTVLGWTSYRDGEHRQALALFDQALAGGRSDVILHGRALSLGALGRHREAADCHAELAREFPDGSLAKNLAFEHAIARFRAGEAGEALLMLMSMEDEDGYLPRAPMQPEYAPIQWIDTIAQFAPLRQLSAPLARLPAADPRARLLRAIVRGRAIAAEDFKLAQRYLDPGDNPVTAGKGYGITELPPAIHMDWTRWKKEVASLAGATLLLEDDRDAMAHLKIARRWMKLRGKLTLPMDRIFDYSRSETGKLDILRRKNAAFLGFTPERIASELDSRDELQHALHHFLAAAGASDDPEIAAPALEEANEALFRLAEYSLYGAARAYERDHSALSARLVERLKKDFPGRPEAARAVVWNFVAPALLVRWMPGDYTPGNSADALAAAVLDPDGGRDRGEDSGASEAEVIRRELNSLAMAPAADAMPAKERLAVVRRRFDASRRDLTEFDLLGLVGDLDDLATVAAAPEISDDLFRRYASLRFSRAAPPAAEGEWAPLAPWLAFHERIRPVDRPGQWQVPNNDTIGSWEAYLAEFPDGPKSEAARLRLLRLKTRAVCPIPQVEAFHFPDAPIPGGYKRMRRPPSIEPGLAAELLRQLDDFDTRFPAGRYRADLLLLRAAVASGSKDYPVALRCLAEVIADPSHPELRMNATLRFAELGLRLLDRHERPAVAAAFRDKREALPFLRNLAHGDTCLSRLRPLLAWLEAE